MNQTFAIATLGCKVNQYESQLIRERLSRSGWRERSCRPGLIVVNTCAVTARAESKGKKLIRSLQRRFPRARVSITGCGLTFSKKQERSLWKLVAPAARVELSCLSPEAGADEITFFAGHSRAFVKVQDGCDSFCSYCIIPYLRGVSRSRRPEKIRAEIISLINNGYREIVLSAIHLGRYGRDLDPPQDLVKLLRLILEEEGRFRIRLGSVEPGEVDSSLIGLIKDNKKLCPHLHLPLQSGSDNVLKMMNRRYTGRDYRRVVGKLREALPEIAITTDIMVGFPGETEEDFELSCRAVEELGFSRVHVFPYSPREGTRAARLSDLPRKVIMRRAARLREISRRPAENYRKIFSGRVVEVLIEEQRPNDIVSGLDEHYLRVEASGEKVVPGSLCRMKIIGFSPGVCRGEVIFPSGILTGRDFCVKQKRQSVSRSFQ